MADRNSFYRKVNYMMLLIIPLILMVIPMVKIAKSHALKSDNQDREEPRYRTLEDAGLSQWKDFTLKSTPDIRKKGVTDISKYYA